MKIVDDDVHWEHLINTDEKENQEEDEEEAPVVDFCSWFPPPPMFNAS